MKENIVFLSSKVVDTPYIEREYSMCNTFTHEDYLKEVINFKKTYPELVPFGANVEIIPAKVIIRVPLNCDKDCQITEVLAVANENL